MKKLYLRMLRGIKSNFGQFLSIVLVIAVGSALLTGMFSAIFGIEKSVDDYYSEQNLADIWAYYTTITPEEVATLSQQDGIVQAQGRYTFNAELMFDGAETTLRVHSITDINVPYLISGSLPQNEFECIIDQKYAEANGIEIGQALELGDTGLTLTVTGLCLDPEYAYKTENAAAAIIDDGSFGYAYASEETLVELNQHSETYLTVRDEAENQLAEAEDVLSAAKTELSKKQDDYEDGLAKVADGWDAYNEGLADYQDGLDQYNDALASYYDSYNETYASLRSAYDTLETNSATLAAAQEQLEENEASLNDSKTQLTEGTAEAEAALFALEAQRDLDLSAIDDQLQTLNDTLTQAQADLAAIEGLGYPDQEAALNEQIDQLNASIAALESTRAQTVASYNEQIETLQANLDTLNAQLQQVNDGLAAIETEKATLETQIAQLQAAWDEYTENKEAADSTFAAAWQELKSTKSQLDTAKTTLDSTLQQLEDSDTTLADAKTELDDAQAQIEEKESELLEAKEDLQESLATLATSYQEVLLTVADYDIAETAVKDNENYITLIEREDQSSYAMVNNSLDPIRTVSYVFPMIFFIVATVIVFISMSKNIEGERTQIAVMQAIGITKRKIRLSFLSYAATCSLIGSVAFAFIGYELIPDILVTSMNKRFSFPTITIPLKAAFIVIPFVLALLFSGAAAWLAVRKVIKEVPAQAMRPRPPKNSKAILAERIRPLWKRLSYSSKLIFRNIFLNKSKVILSSIGVIGSVMLLITGLSLRDSAQTVIDCAIDGMSYDMYVTYSNVIEDKDSLSFDYPINKVELTQTQSATLLIGDGIDTTLQIIEEGSTLVNLFDQDGNLLPFESDSVIIPKSIADDYNLQPGDTVTINIDDQNYDLTITDISVQYITTSVYISYPVAETVGIDTASNAILVSLQNSDDTDAAAQAVSAQDDVKTVSTNESLIQRSREMISTMNTMIYIIIIGAAILSITVIYNITSIVIFERTREFATLMVLGYYKKEVNRLMFAENMTITAFGCLVGIPCGAVLFKYLIGLMSVSSLSFPSGLNPIVVAEAVLIAFGFSVFANLLLMPKIKKIVLVEALKSVE